MLSRSLEYAMDYKELKSGVRRATEEAGKKFVLSLVIIPVSLVMAFYISGIMLGLLSLHILSGFIWFLLVVGSPVVIGTIELGYVKQTKYEMFVRNIPCFTFMAFASGLTAVLSGTLLFFTPSVQSTDVVTWRVLALGAGWFIFVLGLIGPNRFHLGVYYEEKSNIPDHNRIRYLNRKNLIVGGFESLLITGFVVAMNFL